MNIVLGCRFTGIVLLVSGVFASRIHAVSISLTPVADTTLIEVAPNHNNGGQGWVNSGTTQNGPSDRGLFRFDLSAIPTNATVFSASLVLTVTFQPSAGLTDAPFGLHRMLRSWGEGTKFATTNVGQGLPASPGEATWLYSFYPTNAWSAPGGAFDADFSGIESSFQYIYGLASYSFDSTPELVADVQGWVNDPQSNYGWMLLCDDEGTIFTARRFGSREDANNTPQLAIDYVGPPRIDRVERTDNQSKLFFTAEAGQSYVVQYTDFLASSNSWTTLTNLDAPVETTNLVITDSTPAGQRFYRLGTQ